MKELIDKYNNFEVPNFEVKINGENASENGALIRQLNVNTSVEKADICYVNFFNIFDREKNEIKFKDKFFSVGNTIDIKMGYGDKKEDVFSGLITAVNFTFDEKDIEIVVTGMDNSFKMMKGVKSLSWTKKKHSDVAKEIASGYISDVKSDATDTTYDIVEQSRMSDYQFLKWMAKRNNFEFFVSQKKVYFRKPHKSKTPIVNLDMDVAVKNLSIEFNIGDQTGEVIARGIDITKKEQLEGKSTGITTVCDGKTGDSIIKKVIGSGTKEYIYSNEKSKEALNTEATAIANEKAMKLVSGTVLSVGLPELLAGKYLKLKVASNLDKTYYITSSEHKLNESQYTTLVYLGGNTI